jgi:hypothetical protein
MDPPPESAESPQPRQFTLRQLFKVVTALAVFFALPSGAWLLGLVTWGFLLPAAATLAGLMLLQFPLLWLVRRHVLPPEAVIIAEHVDATRGNLADQIESPASENRSPGSTG